MGPESDRVTATTLAAPEEDEPPSSARAISGAEFTLDGQTLDTTGTCNESDIASVSATCTIDIFDTTVALQLDGTPVGSPEFTFHITRTFSLITVDTGVADEGDFSNDGDSVDLTFEAGRNLFYLYDLDTDTGHYFRVNVVPYWELNGDRLSKSDDCRAATDRTAAQITDDDCIVTQFGNAPTIRFHNVIKDQFNVYVHVNGIRVINEPNDTDLAGPFTLDLQDGDNVVKVRLASKTGTHFSESYSTARFHYKVKATDVLVSNLGQSLGVSGEIHSFVPGVATQFTTGSETEGYRISQVRLDIAAEAGTALKVSIYSDSSGQPGSSLKILTNPGAIPTTITELGFGADNYKLDPGTSYWIVVEWASGIGGGSFRNTDSTAEDTGSAAGWSIGNQRSFLSGGTWSTATGVVGVPRIAVKGTVAPAVSDDATLSDLALTDASDNAVALDPTFASDTTSYSATVANSVSQIKVLPTANDSNADIEYLDDSDTTLPDYDTSTAVFDFDLSEGSNVVKVKVTAEDGTTTETYTVTVTRVDFLVSNLGQDTDGYRVIGTGAPGEAVQFTTSDETLGYTISEIQLNLSADAGTAPVVSIYSDNSGAPGSSLTVLDNPDAIPTLETEVDFVADNYKLEPSTPYWIVVERASGSGAINIAYTGLTAEDTGSAAGWSIGDNGLFRSGGTWGTPPNEIIILQVAVKGTVAPSASDDATLSALALRDASDNAVALDPTFASDTTSYNATVANSVSRIKVEPTANDSNAAIEYLDDSDITLADDDTSTAVFDFDLDVGPNVVKVKVTAEDSSTTETYQVTITREATTPGAPASLTATGGTAEATLTWTAPASDGGAAITKYQYRVSADGGTTWAPDWTDVPDGSDSGSDQGDERTVTATNLTNGTEYTFQVRAVNSEGSGSEIEATATPNVPVAIVAPASTDATLSALALTDASNNAVAISPAFASATTSYNATVANSVSRIKVEPTANDSNADIEYLDDSDTTLPDEDTSTAVFDFDLVEGANIVKVKVTAEDGTTTETYTVTVTRVDFLVSNAGSVVTEGTVGPSGAGGTEGIAIQFTTGNHPGVYEVDTVRLRILAAAGTTPRVSIYSDTSGKPGASLKTLANPSAVPTSFAWADFDAGGYRLAPSTSYWIVIERVTGNRQLGF